MIKHLLDELYWDELPELITNQIFETDSPLYSRDFFYDLLVKMSREDLINTLRDNLQKVQDQFSLFITDNISEAAPSEVHQLALDADKRLDLTLIQDMDILYQVHMFLEDRMDKSEFCSSLSEVDNLEQEIRQIISVSK